MHDVEELVASHYNDNDLKERIFAGLNNMGIQEHTVKTGDLSAVEEFHIGGRTATEYLTRKIKLNGTQKVLDVGCGIGGATRYIASTYDCKVTGVDLTPTYIEIAHTLTQLTGLNELVNYECCSALDMPFQDQSYDTAISLHVAMNIEKRKELYREISRVLKPGSKLCVYDVMKNHDGELRFPLPWAQSNETSFLTNLSETISLLNAAGFKILEVEDRSEFARDFFDKQQAASLNNPSPWGVHVVMGEGASEKLKNIKANLKDDLITVTQIIATRY